jgi:hypothetical protein
MNTKDHVLLLLAAGALTASTAVQAQGYVYETVDSPSAPSTQVFGINDRGDAVGNGFDGFFGYPFVYDTKSGTLTDVANVAGYDGTSILAIADNGTLGGSVFDGISGIESGLILDKRGNATVIGHPDAVGFTQVRGLNNSGLAVGFRDDADPLIFGVGFIFDPKNGSFIDLIPSLQTIAQGINSRGDVVGSSVFLPGEDPCDTGFPETTRYGWLRTTDGNITYFSVNGLRTSARGISDSGTIVGFTTDIFTGETKGFVAELDGTQCQDITIADEDLLAFPGSTTTYGQGISNSGTVVGSYLDEFGDLHGFIATPQ